MYFFLNVLQFLLLTDNNEVCLWLIRILNERHGSWPWGTPTFSCSAVQVRLVQPGPHGSAAADVTQRRDRQRAFLKEKLEFRPPDEKAKMGLF